MDHLTLRELIESERPQSRKERMLKRFYLLAPFVATGGALAAIWLVSGLETVGDVVTYGVTSYFLLGKLIILKGITSGSFSPFELAAIVLYLDLAVAAFLTFNLDYAYGIPYLGRRLEGLQEHGRQVLEERPLFRKLTWLGIVLFVMFPLTGTGAIGGSLFGRLLGMGRYRILSGILFGSAVGCFGIAALAEGVATVLPEEVQSSLWFEAIGIAIVVLIVVFLWFRSRRIERGREELRCEAH